MGLNSQGQRACFGNKVNFKPKYPCRGGKTVRGRTFTPNPSGVHYSSMGFPSESHFGTRAFGRSVAFNAEGPRATLKNFPRKNFRKNFVPKINTVHELEIDLTKPWVTEEIINEENKKQKVLGTWQESHEIEDWNKYKDQKLIVQALYSKARTEYAASHPYEHALWQTSPAVSHHYCETCDKSFKTDDDLILHKSEHETCGREGCDFTAHPKIIAKHIKMQHASGLFRRIGTLYTDEDISKWIEERKKNYPTRKVIQEKKILEQEKYNRGERIKDNESKFNKSFTSKNKRSGKKKFEKKAQRDNRRQKNKRSKRPAVLKSLEEEVSSIRKGVPAFQGIKNPNEPEIPENKFEKDFDISDEDWEMDYSVQKVKPVLNSSLQLLAALYESDAENHVREPHKEAKVEYMSADEESSPEEVKTICSKNPFPEENLSEETDSPKKKISVRKIGQERKRPNISNDSHLEKRNLTLLEKLLKNEIRHERNVILQCVHYVIQNNFFKTQL